MLRFAAAGVGFLGLVAARLVFARRFASRSHGGWATFSVVTGVVLLLGFIGVAAGSGNSGAALGS